MQQINETCVILVTLALTLLATVVVALRVVQTKRTPRSYEPGKIQAVFLGLHLDDVFALTALVFCYPSAAMLIWGQCQR